MSTSKGWLLLWWQAGTGPFSLLRLRGELLGTEFCVNPPCVRHLAQHILRLKNVCESGNELNEMHSRKT